jgi:hypothetical protein
LGRRPPVRDRSQGVGSMLTALLLFDGAGKARKLLHLARRRRSSSRALALRPRKVMIAIPRTIASATIAILPRPMRAGDRFAGRREGPAATNPCAKLSRVVKSASSLWASSSLHLAERRASSSLPASGHYRPTVLFDEGRLVPMYRGPRSNTLCEREGPALPHGQRDRLALH